MAVELLLNISITVDLCLRIRMQGCKNFIKKDCWNKLDFGIVCTCILLYMISLVNEVAVGQMSEEILLVAWATAQTLRMVVIAKKQRQAIQSAKALIDFSNIGLDPNHLEQHDRQLGDVEEVITFEDHSKGVFPLKGAESSIEMRNSTAGQLQSSSKLSGMVDRQKQLNLQKRKHRDQEEDESGRQSVQSHYESVVSDRYAL